MHPLVTRGRVVVAALVSAAAIVGGPMIASADPGPVYTLSPTPVGGEGVSITITAVAVGQTVGVSGGAQAAITCDATQTGGTTDTLYVYCWLKDTATGGQTLRATNSMPTLGQTASTVTASNQGSIPTTDYQICAQAAFTDTIGRYLLSNISCQ
jgi:hypothetical protein